MTRRLSVVVLGLSLSSSWGNGHATTYRALLKAFAARGHRVTFLERDVPWYASRRDLVAPDWCELAFYGAVAELQRWRPALARADAVILGSYVPEGQLVAQALRRWVRGVLAFYDIDTPVTVQALAEGRCDYLSPAQLPWFDLYLSFTGGPLLRVLQDRYGARAARVLYCCADLRPPPRPQPRRWDVSYLGTYSADRQPVLDQLLLQPARLAPQLRFAVAGAQYPDDIAWPANVERMEHVAPGEHPAFYAASRFTLNVTRAAMVQAGYSPSVRLFEAAVAGTPIISDSWPGLETVLQPGRDIMVAQTPAEVLAILRDVPEAQRQAMAASARQRVLQGHTADHRAAQLEAYLLAAEAARLPRRRPYPIDEAVLS